MRMVWSRKTSCVFPSILFVGMACIALLDLSAEHNIDILPGNEPRRLTELILSFSRSEWASTNQSAILEKLPTTNYPFDALRKQSIQISEWLLSGKLMDGQTLEAISLECVVFGEFEDDTEGKDRIREIKSIQDAEGRTESLVVWGFVPELGVDPQIIVSGTCVVRGNRADSIGEIVHNSRVFILKSNKWEERTKSALK